MSIIIHIVTALNAVNVRSFAIFAGDISMRIDTESYMRTYKIVYILSERHGLNVRIHTRVDNISAHRFNAYLRTI